MSLMEEVGFMTFKKWFHPANEEERWEVIFFNLKLSIFNIYVAIIVLLVVTIKRIFT